MSLKNVTGSLKVFCGCWIVDMGQMFYKPFWLTSLCCIQDQKNKRCLIVHKRIYDHKGDKIFAYNLISEQFFIYFDKMKLGGIKDNYRVASALQN